MEQKVNALLEARKAEIEKLEQAIKTDTDDIKLQIRTMRKAVLSGDVKGYKIAAAKVKCLESRMESHKIRISILRNAVPQVEQMETAVVIQ